MDVIEDQVQIQQYNNFLFNEKKEQESKEQFYAPVTYAIPATSFEKKLVEDCSSKVSSSYFGQESDYGWDEKDSGLEPTLYKAPRPVSKKNSRPVKQKNVKSFHIKDKEKVLKMPTIQKSLTTAPAVGSQPVAVGTAPVSGVPKSTSLAKSRAAAMRQRVEGKFKKVQTKWVTASDFFVKNSNSPVSPYSGIKADPSSVFIDSLPNYGASSSAALPRNLSVSGVKWNPSGVSHDYGVPSHTNWHAGSGGTSKSLFGKLSCGEES